MGDPVGFPRMPKYVRNDPFGPGGHNNLLQREDFLYDFTNIEHDPATGEHNTPHVSRTLGAVRWSGSAYSLVGFNGDVSLGTGHNPTAGNVILTLAADRYSAQRGVLELQPADETVIVTPWFMNAGWLDDRHVSVVMHKNTAGIGVAQTLAATDGDFFIGIRSPKIPNSEARAVGAERRKRGEGLRVSATNYNPLIQAMGDDRLAAIAGHTAAGLHNTREVAKVCGTVRWDGSAYSMRSHRGLGAGVLRSSEGVIAIPLTDSAPPMVAPVQAFATAVSTAVTDLDDATEDGDYPIGIRRAMVVASDAAPTLVVFLYENYVNVTGGVHTHRWRRVDCDFFIAVHGA